MSEENTQVEATRGPFELADDVKADLSDMFQDMQAKMPESLKDQSIMLEAPAEPAEPAEARENEPPPAAEEAPRPVEEVVPEVVEGPGVMFTHGGVEYKLPLDAEIEVKVDGEIQKVKISDFQSGISGQKAIAQKFSLLDAERKALQKETAVWNDGVTQVQRLAEEGK